MHLAFATVTLYITSCCNFCSKIIWETDEENGLKLSMIDRWKISREVGFSLLGRGGETFLALSSRAWEMHTSGSYSNIAHRKQKTREERLNCPCVEKMALSEMLRTRSSPTAEVTSARTPGWAVEDWQLKHPSGRKHSWFHGPPVIPGWHQHVKPATKGHTAHTTSLAATRLASSLFSFPWHENTTKEGASLGSSSCCPEGVRRPWGAASPLHPNQRSPAASHTQDIHTMDGAEGRGVTGISFTAFFQCSPQSPCIPSNEFFANRSISHHKQTHEPTLILSHLSPLLASSFPGEQVFTKHSKVPF